jgi:hypothetical protein
MFYTTFIPLLIFYVYHWSSTILEFQMLIFFLHRSLIKIGSKSQSMKNIQYDYHLISSKEITKKDTKEKHSMNWKKFLGSTPTNLTHVFHQWGSLKEEYGVIILVPWL